MEHIDATVIDKIRKALINRYDRDQQIQQLIEEIGTEEGLSEQDLIVVYQAYLELKERMQYTANLVDLWNQIESVQERMSLLHTYDRLEADLWNHDIDIVDTAETSVSLSPVKVSPTVAIQDVVSDAEATKGIHDNEEDIDRDEVELEVVHQENYDDDVLPEDFGDEDFDDDDFEEDDDTASYYYKKQEDTRSNKERKDIEKQKKKIEKLLKKQMKHIKKEWAKISGTSKKDSKKNESKKKEKGKSDKDLKKCKKSKHVKETKNLLKAFDKKEKDLKKDKQSKKKK